MKSKEEIVASKLYDLLADSRIEHYLIGRYIAQSFSTEAYDKFLELVSSARQEKQDRVDWLKRVIIGEKEVIDFDTKCEILAGIWLRGKEELSTIGQEFYETNEVGLALAFSVVHNLVGDLSEKGRLFIEDSFTEMLAEYEITEDEIIDSKVEEVIDFIK